MKNKVISILLVLLLSSCRKYVFRDYEFKGRVLNELNGKPFTRPLYVNIRKYRSNDWAGLSKSNSQTLVYSTEKVKVSESGYFSLKLSNTPRNVDYLAFSGNPFEDQNNSMETVCLIEEEEFIDIESLDDFENKNEQEFFIKPFYMTMIFLFDNTNYGEDQSENWLKEKFDRVEVSESNYNKTLTLYRDENYFGSIHLGENCQAYDINLKVYEKNNVLIKDTTVSVDFKNTIKNILIKSLKITID